MTASRCSLEEELWVHDGFRMTAYGVGEYPGNLEMALGR